MSTDGVVDLSSPACPFVCLELCASYPTLENAVVADAELVVAPRAND